MRTVRASENLLWELKLSKYGKIKLLHVIMAKYEKLLIRVIMFNYHNLYYSIH